MTDLSALVSSPSSVAPDLVRLARVISVDKHSLTVDLGNGEGTVVQASDSCNPIPEQTVVLLMSGSRPVAVGALGGAYRQQTMIATGSTTTTATGVVNGASRAVTKAGTFTVTNGDELPLVWSADSSDVWVLGKAGVPYVPPASGGGGTGSSSAPSSYTSYYAATHSGWIRPGTGTGSSGKLQLGSGYYGFFNYGTNRMNELQSRTLVSAHLLLERISGSGSVSVQVQKGVGLGTSTIASTGWVSFPLVRAQELVSGYGSTYLHFTGTGSLAGMPRGTVRITWKP